MRKNESVKTSAGSFQCRTEGPLDVGDKTGGMPKEAKGSGNDLGHSLSSGKVSTKDSAG